MCSLGSVMGGRVFCTSIKRQRFALTLSLNPFSFSKQQYQNLIIHFNFFFKKHTLISNMTVASEFEIANKQYEATFDKADLPMPPGRYA